MNTKNKILKVLEKVPSGTKLYSTAFGNLELESIVEAFGDKRIKLMEENRNRRIYLPDGRYKKGGEVTLYPSREILVPEIHGVVKAKPLDMPQRKKSKNSSTH